VYATAIRGNKRAMFYKLIGMAVWKFASAYVRQRYGRQLRGAAVLGVLSLAIAGYLATRSSDE
jgi:hypothetical protein